MSIFISVLAITTIVCIHELGHFLSAKMLGLPVQNFSIGMGPKIIGFHKKETYYTLRAIPLGGYVQLELTEELHPLKRIFIYISGALFNFILALIIFIGIYTHIGSPTLTVDTVHPNSVAYKSGIREGDTIKSINGIKVNTPDELVDELGKAGKKPSDIDISRDNKTTRVKFVPEFKNGSCFIGIGTKNKPDLLSGIKKGYSFFYDVSRDTVKGLSDIFFGFMKKDTPKDTSSPDKETLSFSDLSGPIGTIQVASKQSKLGILPALLTYGLMSLGIGIFNLLPIPGLDGGRIVLTLLEIIRGGKPISKKIENIATLVGMLFLLALFIGTTVQDIFRLFN